MYFDQNVFRLENQNNQILIWTEWAARETQMRSTKYNRSTNTYINEQAKDRETIVNQKTITCHHQTPSSAKVEPMEWFRHEQHDDRRATSNEWRETITSWPREQVSAERTRPAGRASSASTSTRRRESAAVHVGLRGAVGEAAAGLQRSEPRRRGCKAVRYGFGPLHARRQARAPRSVRRSLLKHHMVCRLVRLTCSTVWARYTRTVFTI